MASRSEHIETAADLISGYQFDVVNDYFLGSGVVNLRDIIEFANSREEDPFLPDALGLWVQLKATKEMQPFHELVPPRIGKLASSMLGLKYLKFAGLDLEVPRGDNDAHNLAVNLLRHANIFFRSQGFTVTTRREQITEGRSKFSWEEFGSRTRPPKVLSTIHIVRISWEDN